MNAKAIREFHITSTRFLSGPIATDGEEGYSRREYSKMDGAIFTRTVRYAGRDENREEMSSPWEICEDVPVELPELGEFNPTRVVPLPGGGVNIVAGYLE